MTLHITQFASVAQNPEGGPLQVAKAPALGSETIVLDGTNQQSAAVNSSARLVRVAVQVDAYISIGTDPDATDAAERIFMPANSVDYFAVGNAMKVAGTTA